MSDYGPTAVSVTPEGLAQCAESAAGTYPVWANAARFSNGANCLAITVCGGGYPVVGSAQLTCGESESKRIARAGKSKPHSGNLQSGAGPCFLAFA
jgi:hypothetical protein